MTKCAPAWRLFLFLFVALSFIGCSQLKRSASDDEKDPHFLDGKRREGGMDWEGAIQSYERALQSNPKNAAAHLELGIIYDKRKNSFAAAIYHYEKHLTLRTNSPRADFIVPQISFCKQELAKTHSYALVDRNAQRELERLVMTNDLLRKRVDYLEAEINRGPRYMTNYVTNFVKLPQPEVQSSSRLTQPTQIVDPPIQDEPPAPKESARARTESQNTRNGRSGARGASVPPNRAPPGAATPAIRTVHTVRPGETLQVLAGRYGLSVTQIRAANPGLGSGTRSGQKIIIPAK